MEANALGVSVRFPTLSQPFAADMSVCPLNVFQFFLFLSRAWILSMQPKYSLLRYRYNGSL